MTPRPRRTSKGPGRLWAVLLLVNLPALGAMVWIGVAQARGEIVMSEIPRGQEETLRWVVGSLVALLVVASLLLPTIHRGVVELWKAGGTRVQILAGRQPGSRVGAFLALPLISAAHGATWAVRLVLILVSLALVGVVLVLLVRLFRPEFLEGPIRAGLAWRPPWGGLTGGR